MKRHNWDMAKRPPKSPQQKKALSLAKDRRNAYGENDKASRKAIPLRKAKENRRVRRAADQLLNAAATAEEEVAATVESSLRHDVKRVGGWKKAPDVPLSDYLKVQARRRSWRGLPANRTKVESEQNGE
jgi:hypothetical protein